MWFGNQHPDQGTYERQLAIKVNLKHDQLDQHYHEFNPGQQIPEEYIEKILDALEGRFKKALTRKFVPELSEVGTTFRAPRAGDSDANWAVARRLLVSVAEYPRKAIKDYNYFFRGLQIEPEALLDAMNVLDDQIVSHAADRRAEQIAKDELECLGAIEVSLPRLWYTGPPMKGGIIDGQCTVHRCAGPPHRVPGCHQPDARRVSAAGPTLRGRVPSAHGRMAPRWATPDRPPVYRR
jgi:hypothetical protein